MNERMSARNRTQSCGSKISVDVLEINRDCGHFDSAKQKRAGVALGIRDTLG